MTAYLTLTIIAVTVVTSYRAFNDGRLMQRMLFNPYAVDRERDYVRLLSAGFIHADWLHLIINMYVLYIFGEITEYMFHGVFGRLGGLFYVVLYAAGIVASHVISFFRYFSSGFSVLNEFFFNH